MPMSVRRLRFERMYDFGARQTLSKMALTMRVPKSFRNAEKKLGSCLKYSVPKMTEGSGRGARTGIV